MKKFYSKHNKIRIAVLIYANWSNQFRKEFLSKFSIYLSKDLVISLLVFSQMKLNQMSVYKNLYTNVHNSFICISQKLEISTNHEVINIPSILCYIHKMEILFSRKEERQVVHVLLYMWELRFVKNSKRNTCV